MRDGWEKRRFRLLQVEVQVENAGQAFSISKPLAMTHRMTILASNGNDKWKRQMKPLSRVILRVSKRKVKARVRGGLAMCIVAFSGCGAGSPRRKFWGYVITFN